MKKITAVIAESGKHHDLEMLPGTTAQDVLNQVGLPEGYVLSSGKGQEPFGSDEEIYSQIADGCKLFASTPVEVGSGPLSSFFESFLNSILDFLAPLEQPQVPNKVFRPKCRNVGPNVIKRAEIPYWRQRGWRMISGKYRGHYSTGDKSFKGEATISNSGRVELFIFNPPDCLRKHPHWHCFIKKLDGRFFIHNNKNGTFDLSSGIMDVERILKEALEL